MWFIWEGIVIIFFIKEKCIWSLLLKLNKIFIGNLWVIYKVYFGELIFNEIFESIIFILDFEV